MPEPDAENTRARKCIVSGDVLPADRLIRFVRGPDGSVVPDLKRRLPGRGVWVSRSAAAVEQAAAGKLFARGFKAACSCDGNLADRVDALLVQQCLGYLALANKAGQVVQGYEKVLGALTGGELGGLIGAHDGSADGRDKLKARRRSLGLEHQVRLIEIFDSGQLGLALGRTNVIHAGVKAGDLARKFSQSAEDIALFRSKDRAQGQ